MLRKKSIHIISHTHWDREWYLPYEKHHVLLIGLMDKLLETLEEKPDFRSFHLDGQTIMLDDYLLVRPENRRKLERHIEEGRIQIGPWYILQDEFLTSSESNIRNLIYGMKACREWGGLAKVGYFPDSFGNIGQAPQILKQAGIEHAVFGRGVKPTGFNNTVGELDSYESPYSELRWESPDGSSVLGILFANWYCNGNEIPVSASEAKVYWDQHIASLEKFASTGHMLMMNGCDHQPIQTNLPEAIRTAEKLYPEYEIIHSSFNEYIEALAEAIPEDLQTVTGELRSQQTDGWGTLVNTASSRVYLKQMNQHGQAYLEKGAEPLATFAYLCGKDYDHGLLAYAWKTLMQNHPHDSICGCSVDEVHREMVARFDKSRHVAEMVAEESLSYITEKIDGSVFRQIDENAIAFAVFNTSGWERTGTVDVLLDVKKSYYSDGVNKKELQEFSIEGWKLMDSHKKEYSYTYEDLGLVFDYDLPDDKFRQPYMARRVKMTFEAVDIPAAGYKSFALVDSPCSQSQNTLIVNGREMENDHLHVKVNGNGSLSILNKHTGKNYDGLCIYENTGDIGNEYMYRQPNGDKAITTEHVEAKVSVLEDTPSHATIEILQEMQIPESADELLEKEQKELVWFTARKAGRSERKIPFAIRTVLKLGRHSKGVDVHVSYNNQAKDHRLRVLMPTGIQAAEHHADSIFEIAVRPNRPSAEWKNPDHSQHQQAFVEISNETEGLTVGNLGLNEYEVITNDAGDNTIAVTLIRCTGEMGDWGHFPTPDAQCLGEHSASFRIFPHGGESDSLISYRDAYQYQFPMLAKQFEAETGTLPADHSFIEWHGQSLALTALKVSQESGDIVARWFNMTGNPDSLQLKGVNRAVKSNVLEEPIEELQLDSGMIDVPVKKHEILTILLERNGFLG